MKYIIRNVRFDTHNSYLPKGSTCTTALATLICLATSDTGRESVEGGGLGEIERGEKEATEKGMEWNEMKR